MNPCHVAAVSIMQTMMQLQRVLDWMHAEGQNWPPEVQMYLGRFMIQVYKHTDITMKIIKQPTVIRPPAGQRCIFY